jgi:hypothetical protein
VIAKNQVGPGTTRHFAVTRRAIESRMGTSPHLREWPDISTSINAEELGKMTTGQQGIRATLEAIQQKTEARLSRRANR